MLFFLFSSFHTVHVAKFEGPLKLATPGNCPGHPPQKLALHTGPGHADEIYSKTSIDLKGTYYITFILNFECA